jgi:hypothetical protein
MAKTQLRLEQFLHGQKWAAIYARRSLPILVRFVEQHRGKPDSEIPVFTYKSLAIAVGQPTHAHPIMAALGTLGFALKELGGQHLPGLGEIPPIQLLVWSKGKGSPGELAFGFIGKSKEEVQELPARVRHAMALAERTKILEYKSWRKVLAKLGLKPLTLDLPDPESVINSSSGEQSGYGESEEHKRLKFYLGSHYRELHIRGQFAAKFEEKLFSGDVSDLMLDEIRGTRRFGVEVKSRISKDSDLIRGIFQCVKYKAVLTAQEKYESSRTQQWVPKTIEVILASERELPEVLQQLSELLNVKVVRVTVPTSYQPNV